MEGPFLVKRGAFYYLFLDLLWFAYWLTARCLFLFVVKLPFGLFIVSPWCFEEILVTS